MDHQSETILQLQADVLERIAVGAGLRETLAVACRLVEGMVPGSICSIMLLSPDGTLEVAAAPRASAELIEGLNGLLPSDMAGSCGTAVFQEKPVYVRDTSTDPRWSQLRKLALEFRIEACWSVPILSRENGVLGSFAISHAEPREPTAFHRKVLKAASWLAGIAVERDLSEKAVQQAQKLESLGVLTGGIAHDFNNLLVGILGNAHLALSEVDPSTSTFSLIGRIQEAGERAADLIDQLLAYAGKGEARVEAVDLRSIMKELTELLRSSVSRDVVLEFDSSDECLWVDADATQIRQLGMNLVTNAADSIAGGGRVSVRTGAMTADQIYLRRCYVGSTLCPGDYNFVEVRDTGCGMDACTIERIFDPFFTTKEGGHGLGLSATLGIVKAHGGALWIDSKPGMGTTFRVLFPRERGTRADSRRRQSDVERSDTATVLVVDDEELVIAVTERVLAHDGYRVLTERSGAGAIARARDLGDELDAVVLDVSMPGMNGEETFRALRDLRDDLPVVFCSGHGTVEGRALVRGRRQTTFVAKPFSPENMRQALSRLLRRSRGQSPATSVSSPQTRITGRRGDTSGG